MSIVFPDERTAQRWNGALEESLKRQPLESFLRSKGLKVAPRGPARDSDNISRAALFVLRMAVARLPETQPLSSVQCVFVGQATCCICDSLAALIKEPRAWRVAALVSTTQLMPRSVGLLAAANLAATAAREFPNRSRDLVDEFQQMARMASEAIAQNANHLLQELSSHIACLIEQVDATAIPAVIGSLSPAGGVQLRGRRLV